MKPLQLIVTVTVVTIVLSGCAVSSKVVLPSGGRGYSINCSGAALTWGQCYEKAGSLCPHGYKIIEQEGQKPGTMVSATPSYLFGAPVVDRTMLVQCKPALSQPPK
jgi:hypothetical protein